MRKQVLWVGMAIGAAASAHRAPRSNETARRTGDEEGNVTAKEGRKRDSLRPVIEEISIRE
jgi:hypothetical protein